MPKVIAGIDEAGYGPILGPLVVGLAGVELSSDPGLDRAGVEELVPDLWSTLRCVFSKSKDRTGKRLHVNDSKLVYTPSVGLSNLERTVLSLVPGVTTLDELIVQLAPGSSLMRDDSRGVSARSLLEGLPWYEPSPGELFPCACTQMSLSLSRSLVRRGLASCGATRIEFKADVIPETRLNRMFDVMNSKGSVLASVSMALLYQLLVAHEQKGLLVVCDRQGGRTSYGPLLRTMLEDWQVATVSERDGFGHYTLTRDGYVSTVVFLEKSEQKSLPTALASMMCKYLRERLMMRLSRYWMDQVPTLKATAGYWTDGQRFLADLKAAGFDPTQMIRNR